MKSPTYLANGLLTGGLANSASYQRWMFHSSASWTTSAAGRTQTRRRKGIASMRSVSVGRELVRSFERSPRTPTTGTDQSTQGLRPRITALACRSGTDGQTGAHTFGSDPRGWPGTTSTGSCTGSSGVRPRKPRPSTTLNSAPESTPVTRNEMCIKPRDASEYVISAKPDGNPAASHPRCCHRTNQRIRLLGRLLHCASDRDIHEQRDDLTAARRQHSQTSCTHKSRTAIG